MNEPVTDPSYPTLADFWNAGISYLHLMGMSKKNRFILKQLMCKVRQHFPDHYYEVLRLMERNNIKPVYLPYSLTSLSPLEMKKGKFLELMESFDPALSPKEEAKWPYYYAKDAFVFQQVELFTRMPTTERHDRTFTITPDVAFRESDDGEEVSLLINNTFDLNVNDILLDDLEILILDKLQDQHKSILDLMNDLRIYFDPDDFVKNGNLLLEKIEEKMKTLMSFGAIRLINFKANFVQPTEVD